MNGLPVTLPLLPLVNGLRSGEIPLFNYLDQLEALFQQREPEVHSFLPEEGRFDRLRREAQQLLDHYPQPLTRPPLFGIPVGVKDIFHAKGFETRGGSSLPPEVLRGPEARSVTLLKEAGALILGKTVSTEFAYFGPGPTRNPHCLTHTPGGSSSGSAAAVAANLCPIALGTQTIGSIIRPASFCGVVGYKPSYDRVTRAGVIPLAPSLDHVGVFTAGVAGAELVASILCPDWHLAITGRRPVLGVPEGPYLERASAEGLAHFEATCQRLAEAGCVIRRSPTMPDFDEIVVRHNLIVAAEAAQVHADWFANYSELYHQRTADLIRRGRPVAVGDLAEALTGRRRLRQELIMLMDEQGLDLWITPAAPGPAPEGLDSTGDPVMNLPWTHSGLPSVNLPAGANEAGLPLGLQVAGRWYEDETLLEWAAELEPVVRAN
ncbi:MAG: amidase [Chloroflexi bacterium]|nr:amidase [Chloroflexota bacterium]MCI0576414.1 amidase [Chloroflexota bacterium]MCI0644286.1 amidase [Chloroflexota bacterium]MCI0726269.1 amidase [Chloroflexota bacterium]